VTDDLKVAVLQSNYLPWRGYFDIINDVDLFVFYDDVQYTKNDWRNRNIIKSAQGPQWLTVPVGQDISRLICEVTLPNPRWQQVHWKSISQTYAKAKYFDLYRHFFEDVYLRRQWTSLSELNQYLIRHISTDFLKVRTGFADSRTFALEGTKQNRLMVLLAKLRARRYLSGPSGRDYLDCQAFAKAGIELVYKEYHGYRDYPQFGAKFDPRVSIVDVLFHCGPASREFAFAVKSP
jgi:hypothetical protein